MRLKRQTALWRLEERSSNGNRLAPPAGGAAISQGLRACSQIGLRGRSDAVGTHLTGTPMVSGLTEPIQPDVWSRSKKLEEDLLSLKETRIVTLKKGAESILLQYSII